MLPITSTGSTYTTPPPIVNSAVPGSTDTHAPPTVVAPSFSSAQVDNNARGNSTYARSKGQPPAAAPALSSSTISIGVPPSASEKYTLGAQTNFLAQMIAQEASAEAQGVLSQYEKLISFSNVKYAPSEAFRPEEQPSNLFGKLLQVESKAQAATSVQQTQASGAQAIVATSANRPAVEAAPFTRSKANTFTQDLAEEDAREASQAAASAPQPRAISAYLNTASRVSAQSQEDRSSEDLVSQVA